MKTDKIACIDIIHWAGDKYYSQIEEVYKDFDSHQNVREEIYKHFNKGLYSNTQIIVAVFSLAIHKEKRDIDYYKSRIRRIAPAVDKFVFIKDLTEIGEIDRLSSYTSTALHKTTHTISGIVTNSHINSFIIEAEALPKRIEY